MKNLTKAIIGSVIVGVLSVSVVKAPEQARLAHHEMLREALPAILAKEDVVIEDYMTIERRYWSMMNKVNNFISGK